MGDFHAIKMNFSSTVFIPCWPCSGLYYTVLAYRTANGSSSLVHVTC